MSPLSPEMQAELARLHDIRLPPPVGWWPLAPGWWVLFALLLVVIMVALALEYRRRRTVRYIALRELSGLKARLAAKAPAPDVATELAVLLRRVVLSGPTPSLTMAGHRRAEPLDPGVSRSSDRQTRP